MFNVSEHSDFHLSVKQEAVLTEGGETLGTCFMLSCTLQSIVITTRKWINQYIRDNKGTIH